MNDDSNGTSATGVDAAAGGITPRRRVKVNPWRLPFYALAAFVVLTTGFSVILNHRIITTYKQSIAVDEQWSGYSNRLLKLSRLAMHANAPGNDVFESLDVAGETKNLDSAMIIFEKAMEEMRAELNAMTESQRVDFLADLDDIRDSVIVMTSESRQILKYVEQGQIGVAAVRMALMDRSYGHAIDAVGRLHDHLEEVQQAVFAGHLASADRLRRMELLIVLLVVVLIAGTAFYGNYLSRSALAAAREMERALEAASAAEARFRAVIDVSGDGIIVADRHGTIESFNPAAGKMFGYTSDEIAGQNLRSLMPEPDRSAHDGYLHRYLTTKQPRILGMRRPVELTACRKDGSIFPITLAIESFEENGNTYFSGSVHDISEEKVIRDELQLLGTAIEYSDEAIAVTDTAGRFKYVNPAFTKMTGYRQEEAVGQTPSTLLKSGEHDDEFYAEMWTTITRNEVWKGRMRNRKKDGTIYDEMQTISSIQDPQSGEITGYVAIKRDISAQLQLERQLAQAQKLESIGQLAAGIAHEINTPTQYVGDNTRFVKDAFEDVGVLFTTLNELMAAANGSVSTDALAKAMETADVDYLQEEVPRALEQSMEGVERVAKIVRAMKEFSHPAQDKTPLDLNSAIQSTATVASNEWKYVAEMHTEFDPELPMVTCLPGQFNQVILNMIVNAAHAIADVLGDEPGEKGAITITTRALDDCVQIRIADTGAGMPEDVSQRIFDPFFTTKEVGKGTGQGLSIAHTVVVEKHGGTIEVDSTPGEGTCFTICLPLDETASAEDATAA